MMNKYMAMVTSTETSGRRTRYQVGPNFMIEITACDHDLTNRHDLMNIWKKAGFIAKTMPTHLSIDTYYTDETGCWGLYNITEKLSEDGKRRVIDFDYLREATPDNERELVAECIRLAVEAGAIA